MATVLTVTANSCSLAGSVFRAFTQISSVYVGHSTDTASRILPEAVTVPAATSRAQASQGLVRVLVRAYCDLCMNAESIYAKLRW